MSGLNPDGLGINRTFGETETETVRAESVNTDNRTLNGVSGEATTIEPKEGTAPHGGGIQEAINNANPGDTLELKPNTTYVTKGTTSDGGLIVIDKDDITLRGFGAGSQIKHDVTTIQNGQGCEMVEVDANNVTLENFTINGDFQSLPNTHTITDPDDGHNLTWFGNDGTCQGIRSINSTGDGLETTTAENLTVTGCLFKDVFEQCVHFNSCKNVTVTGCVLDGEVNNGVVSTYSGVGLVCEGNVLANNIIRGGDVQNVIIEPGDGTVRDFVCEGNIIEDAALGGVVVRYDSQQVNPPEGIQINDNIIKGCRDGVYIQDGTHVRVKDNEIHSNDRHGVHVFRPTGAGIDDVTLVDNEIHDNATGGTGKGIESDSNGGTISEFTIEDNRITGSHDRAIGMSGTFSDSYCEDNFVKGAVSSPMIVPINPTGMQVRHNEGHPTETTITADLSNGDTVQHGLVKEPNIVQTSVQGFDQIANQGSTNGSTIAVQLFDTSGAAVGSTRPVIFEAKYWPDA